MGKRRQTSGAQCASWSRWAGLGREAVEGRAGPGWAREAAWPQFLHMSFRRREGLPCTRPWCGALEAPPLRHSECPLRNGCEDTYVFYAAALSPQPTSSGKSGAFRVMVTSTCPFVGRSLPV